MENKDKKFDDMPAGGFVPPMADISWVKRKYLDISYDSVSKAQALDIYLPDEGDGPFPALIHIHGGGFMLGDKRDDHMNAYLKALHQGMAAVSIEYRLSKEAVFPAAVLDVRQAIRYLRDHAAEYCLDADKFVVIGGSAGGNLAAMLGMNVANGAFPGEEGKEFSTSPFVALAIDQFGPMNFATMDEQARANGISHVDHDDAKSPESMYVGGPIQENLEAVGKANPATYISDNMVDFLVQHGNKDVLVPYEQSVEFVDAIKAKAGDDKVTFIPVDDAGHEDKKFFADDNMKLVFDFIRDKLGL